MDFFKVTSLAESKEIIRKQFIEIFSKKEIVPLSESIGRYSASKIVSRDSVPSFDKSTVDGYAVRSESTHGASDSIPSMLNLKGEVEMGKENKYTINSSETVYVPTGGMIPYGADAVVMIEYSEVLGDEIFLNTSVAKGENVIYKGEDLEKGDILLEAGKKIRPQNIGTFAAGGITEIEVAVNPNFYIISTGDEVKSLGSELKPGEIIDINSYTLEALVNEWGCKLEGRTLVGDNLEILKNEIKKGIEVSDILILSGGSSVGSKDYTCRAIKELGGKILVHGMSIKPGKPTIIGGIHGKLVIGLPGHPVSALMVFKALLEDFLNKDKGEPYRRILKKEIHSTPGRTTYQPVVIDGDFAVPLHGKSGVISLLNKAFGYTIIPPDKEGFDSGDIVDIWAF
ncbi:molybdopterin molybdotransferase MoeA [uncultured Ilyobacter sp.]|uniref:molybdopterin molybdotransferase MoeA n=1 Tax=uncultured Ilyobacter sp. TaxID=544433 RepID=UPI0029C0C1EF|nr:molybdopterin molybdotransferase MoeA [uncultured Ilyobacter sp.]